MVRGSSALIWRKSELNNAARRDKERAAETGFKEMSTEASSIHRPPLISGRYLGTSPGKGAKETSHKRHSIGIDPGLSIPLYCGDLASSMDSSAPSKAVRGKLPLVRGGEVVL
ncbi:hypothetical protein CCHR01_16424 [Colletotrichum chrysophilum]|uniref:Uncharacterized protein n=1 Tax=Colletotrichum chrysophilum TaxID=1836956 RepID=A0AAD9A8H6_9PEZI|nr:hypothetical protein CCHR01_16424 [Colletotrichum chrysophilum]